MLPPVILHLFAAVPVFYWPVLVAELLRLLPEIRAAAGAGRGGWIEYDRTGRLWLVPAADPAARAPAGTLEKALAPQRRQLAIALSPPERAVVPAIRPAIRAGLTALVGTPEPVAPDTS